MVVGDSHVVAMMAAQRDDAAPPDIQEIDVLRLARKKFFRQIGDVDPETLEKRLGELNSKDLLVSAIGGNEYASLGTVRHAEPFDFIDPAVPSLEPASTLIPRSSIDATFDKMLDEGLAPRLQNLRRKTVATVVHLSSPPPKKDLTHAAAKWERKFLDMGIAEVGPAAPELRLKCWRAQHAALERLCAANDILLLDPPAGTRDEVGYLARDCYSGDVTHANAVYGRKVLEQVSAILSCGAR